MSNGSPKLRTLDEIERECIPGLVEILQQEGLKAVRYSLWEMTNWHWDYDPLVWKDIATEEQKREGWQMWVRMEEILHKVVTEARDRQLTELSEVSRTGPERLYS